jgi:hypothetical protein
MREEKSAEKERFIVWMGHDHEGMADRGRHG